MASVIRHKGIVKNIDGSRVCVEIIQASACSSCGVRQHCRSSESKQKIIEAYEPGHSYKPGDEVMLVGAASMGMKAVLIAFVFPFVLLLVVLFASMSLSHGNELLSSLLSLSFLIPYYIILYFLRDKFKEKFSFTLKPINNN